MISAGRQQPDRKDRSGYTLPEFELAPELQDGGSRLELGIGLGTNRGHGGDTNHDDQSEHHGVFNGGWAVFRNDKILHTSHQLVHYFPLLINTEFGSRTRDPHSLSH